MLENEHQSNVIENEAQQNTQEIAVDTKKSNTVKIYALSAIIATVIAVVLKTVCLLCFYDADIGYHSEGIVTSLFDVFCLLLTLFFASSIFCIKRDTATPDGKGNNPIVKIGSTVAMLAFAVYFGAVVFSTDLISTTTAFDLISKLTALMGIVYFAISVFAPNTNKNIRALLGFGVIIWCIYVLGVTYFDIYIQLNSPDKVMLHLALISIMVFIVSELRCFVFEIKKGFYIFSACAATLFCALTSIPSFIYGGFMGDFNDYYIYNTVIVAVGIYSLMRLVSFAFIDEVGKKEALEVDNAEKSDEFEYAEISEKSDVPVDSEKESEE